MGWKDAPLVTREGGKPKWQSAPIAKRDDSFARGVALGAVQPLDALARAASNIPVIGPAIDRASEALGMPTAAQAAASNRAARQANTSTAGQLVGNIAGTLPTMALPGGALVQGAAGGALLSEGETAGQVLTDAAIGAGGARLAQGAINTVRNAAAPRVSDFVRRLSEAGVELTPGQIVGGAVRRIEDAATSLPFVGDAIRGAQRRSVETFNRAAVNRALSPLGLSLPDNVATGNDAVRFAGDRLSEGYNRVLSSLSGQVDNTFWSRIGTIRQRVNLPAEEAAQFDDIVRREIGAIVARGQGATPQQNATFSGRTLNQARDRLDKVASTLRANTQSPYARELGEAIGQVRDQLTALARRQNPTAADTLRRLDRGYAELVRVERAAANAATEGVFTPGQFTTAVRGADRSARRRAVARGQALGQEFANDARRVLPATIPDSGTAGRLMTAGLGGAAVAAPGAVLPAVAGGAAVMGAYSRPATRAFQQFVTRQPGAASQFLDRFLDRTPISVAVPALLKRPDE